MRIEDLRADSGERSVRVSWIGGETRLCVAVPEEFAVQGMDMTAFIPLVLMLAMRRAEPLQVDGPVSRQLLESLPAAQETLSAWSPTFTRVPVRAREHAAPAPPAAGRACGFSRGVDSMYSASRPRREGEELTHLVYVDGFDPVYKAESRPARIAAARAAAEKVGLPLVLVRTNMSEVIDHVVDFEDAFGAGLAMVGLSLAGGIGSFVLASSRDYGGMLPVGSHPLLDHRWSTEGLTVEHDSVVLDRPGKVRWLVEQRPDLVPWLHVCWETDSARNCGRCWKCLGTALLLHVAGGLENAGSLPPTLDLDRVRRARYPALISRLGMNDTYRAIPPGPEYDDLRSAIAELLRRSAGIPPDESPHGISRHQNRLYEALMSGRPLPDKAAGPRWPEATVGPLEPAWPPPRDVAPGRLGLVVGVDVERRRHVYSAGSLPPGARIGELGALLAEQPGDGVPLLLDRLGRPSIAELVRRRPNAPAAARWALAPLAWRDRPLRPRLRSAARRAAELLGALTTRQDSPTSAAIVGWLHANPGEGRQALWAARHPVHDDVLLTSQSGEAERLGYEQEHLLGYLEACAPVTGELGVARPPLVWLAEWGSAPPSGTSRP